MDESTAFLLASLAFFLTICIFAFVLEVSRNSRASDLEMLRHNNRMHEQRAFGFDPVTERNANQQSVRRFIK